ncbi:protein of unknown function [Rhodovastum atsumiense]|nr:protein of unknown function [Rhodovastum atsumiense]
MTRTRRTRTRSGGRQRRGDAQGARGDGRRVARRGAARTGGTEAPRSVVLPVAVPASALSCQPPGNIIRTGAGPPMQLPTQTKIRIALTVRGQRESSRGAQCAMATMRVCASGTLICLKEKVWRRRFVADCVLER